MHILEVSYAVEDMYTPHIIHSIVYEYVELTSENDEMAYLNNEPMQKEVSLT